MFAKNVVICKMQCHASFLDVKEEEVFEGYRDALSAIPNLHVCNALEAKEIVHQEDTIVLNALSGEYEKCTVSSGKSQLPETFSGSCAIHCAHSKCSAAAKYITENKEWLSNNCENIYYLHEGVKGLLADEIGDKLELRGECPISLQERIQLDDDVPETEALHGKNIVITGGTRGLGRLQAFHALKNGANHVTITGREAKDGGTTLDGERTEAELSKLFSRDRITYVKSDVRRDSDNKNLFDPEWRISNKLPADVHSASLNAGIFGPAGDNRRVDLLDSESYDNVMDTNCKGVFLGIKHFVDGQKNIPDKKIVAIKSIYGSQGSSFSNAAYQSSKFCVDGLVKQSAVSLARTKTDLKYPVQVNSVSPGFAKSSMTGPFYENQDVSRMIASAHPTGSWVNAHDVATTVTWLLNAPSSVTGVDIFVDNGVMAQSVPDNELTSAIKTASDAPCCGKEA